MNLTTTYMGLKLRSPLVPSAAQPLSDDIDSIKRMEDAGAAAIVIYSVFEEQLTQEKLELFHHLTEGTESFAEAQSYFPEPAQFELGPEGYLKHLQKARESVGIPVIGSLNGSTAGGWTSFAKQIQQAGADAVELNIYNIPTDLDLPGSQIEDQYIEVVKAVKAAVTIPVSVKISPFFSNLANMARKLDDAGADGLTLFNRFYQPDVDLETLEVRPNVLLSTPQAMRLPLRWIAILYGRVNASLAATSGIHKPEDMVKMLLAGASVTEVCSVLLRYGINHMRDLEQGLHDWMESHEYESVEQMRGSMSQVNCADPTAYERVQYMRAVTSFNPELYRAKP
ncbi:MAG: dihydroorotate dehydrogenase-like protein [bacterium]|nr:dihydroorotate dehydrogenase-like protein [Candidatus Sumerlaeota bacterium]